MAATRGQGFVGDNMRRIRSIQYWQLTRLSRSHLIARTSDKVTERPCVQTNAVSVTVAESISGGITRQQRTVSTVSYLSAAQAELWCDAVLKCEHIRLGPEIEVSLLAMPEAVFPWEWTFHQSWPAGSRCRLHPPPPTRVLLQHPLVSSFPTAANISQRPFICCHSCSEGAEARGCWRPE